MTARLLVLPLLLLSLACARGRPSVNVGPGEATLVTTVTGFSGPEAVRYDPDQDVYFVANFNGAGDARDNNGFISRVTPEGAITALKFVAGGENGVTLHAPRGMFIMGDTLWVADADAVRGFHRKTGAAVARYDFSSRDVGFLNDVAGDPDGILYVTDTGKDRIYRLYRGDIEVAITDSALGGPNGITWDPWGNRFLVVPYFRGTTIIGWRPGAPELEIIALSPGREIDGVEVLASDQILIATQSDSSVHLIGGGTSRRMARTAGDPADIGVDTRRARVAVPFISRNAVEIWALPRN